MLFLASIVSHGLWLKIPSLEGYTMKLKEEINRLCGELKKVYTKRSLRCLDAPQARQRIVQLEVSKESENLFDALALGAREHRASGRSRLWCPCCFSGLLHRGKTMQNP